MPQSYKVCPGLTARNRSFFAIARLYESPSTIGFPPKKGNAGLIEGRENEDEKEYILLPPSTEGLIEVDDTLYFIKAVGYLCQLGRE